MQQRPFSLTHMPPSALSQIAIYVMNKINELWFRMLCQYSSNLKCIEHWSIVNPVHPGSQVLELLCSQHGGGREGMLKTNATIISHGKKRRKKRKWKKNPPIMFQSRHFHFNSHAICPPDYPTMYTSPPMKWNLCDVLCNVNCSCYLKLV